MNLWLDLAGLCVDIYKIIERQLRNKYPYFNSALIQCRITLEKVCCPLSMVCCLWSVVCCLLSVVWCLCVGEFIGSSRPRQTNHGGLTWPGAQWESRCFVVLFDLIDNQKWDDVTEVFRVTGWPSCSYQHSNLPTERDSDTEMTLCSCTTRPALSVFL